MAEGHFVAVNCTAVPVELAESMFFGHTKGAFTGAASSRIGFFEQSDGGTLFLDEIGDMPLDMQGKLLRVIEDGSITPIGAQREKHVDVRIIAATNTDLVEKMRAEKFREDLYFRIASFIVSVPPLRERPEDIPLLAYHFLSLFATDMGIERPELSQKALESIMSYDFPGNVRELKHIIEGALIRSGGEPIQPEHLYFLQTSISSSVTESLADESKPREVDTINVDELYQRMTEGRESFWDVVYTPFMDRELNRLQVQDVIKKGLEKAWGSYKTLLSLFGLPESDYQKFMDFLRHHSLKPTLE
jgi:transcriptional regulator with GAF, ATPase, and Fis domain